MRVCDVTKDDEAVAAVQLHLSDEDEAVTIDVGTRALEAFRAQDWKALGQMAAPPRKKNKSTARSQAAKRGAATRNENRERARQEAEQIAAAAADRGDRDRDADAVRDGKKKPML